jgi:hypothetical protein
MSLVLLQLTEIIMQTPDDIRRLIANTTIAPPFERAVEIVLPHMRGACVNVGNVAHTLFRWVPAHGPDTDAGAVVSADRS